jgi:hypothetical protein
MEKLLEKMNYFVYDSQADYFDLDKGQAKLIVEKLEEKQDVDNMYNLVFQDMVQDYIESLNYDLVENKEYLTLTEQEKQKVAIKLYRNEYLQDVINEIIDYNIGNILIERGKNNE